MRFEIRVHKELDSQEPVLLVLLFTRKDEDYLNGCEDGIYNCASTYPEDKKKLISMIEVGVNGCLRTYEEDLQQTLDNLVEKCEPKLKEFHELIEGA